MIFRLSQKLAKKLKAGNLPALSADENPYADWSANLFNADRTQYIILTNTLSLYSIVMYARGITDDSRFIQRALDNIREFLDFDGQEDLYQRLIAPASHRVQFGKALSRSVTGSMNDLIYQSKFWLVEEELSPIDVGFKLNDIPMSAIKYEHPKRAFQQLAEDKTATADTAPLSPASSEGKGEVIAPTEKAIRVTLTAAQRKILAEILPEFADRLKLDEKNARTLSFASDELETIGRKANEAISEAQDGKRRISLRHIVNGTAKAIEDSKTTGPIPKSERLYQFKITLLESEPPIWRRIQVKDGTLNKLHEHIQTAIGWTNSHLHQFEIEGVIHGDPLLLCDGWQDEALPVDSRITRISEVVPEDGTRCVFCYEYDFGDSWRHEILFEGILRAGQGERYPLCVEGQRACPPEDVGGVWGYADFLEALADPSHEQHEDFMEWGGPFDAEAFDAQKATKRMRRGLLDWREHL